MYPIKLSFYSLPWGLRELGSSFRIRLSSSFLRQWHQGYLWKPYNDRVTLFWSIGTVFFPCSVRTGRMINSAQMLAQNSLETCLLFTNFLLKTDKYYYGLSPLVFQHSVSKQDSEGIESTMSLLHFLCRWPWTSLTAGGSAWAVVWLGCSRNWLVRKAG